MTDNVATGLFERLASEQLLSDADLQKAQAISADDPNQWAKEMIEAGLLTRWQASRLLTRKGPLTLGPFILLDRIPILGGSELFAGWKRDEGVARWLEVLPAGAQANGVHLSPRTDTAVPSGSVETIDERLVIDHGLASHGTCVALTLKKGVRWDRVDAGVMLRDACKALKPLHTESKAIGRITPTSFVKAEVGYRLATWGALASDRTADDPYTAAEAVAPASPVPASDVYSLGMTAMVLVFGTSSPSKVQAKSRFDQIVLKMVEADATKRPNVAALIKALDEWLATKQVADAGAGVTQGAEEPEALDHLEVVESPTESAGSAVTEPDFAASHSESEKPASEKPASEKPASEKPATEKPAAAATGSKKSTRGAEGAKSEKAAKKSVEATISPEDTINMALGQDGEKPADANEAAPIIPDFLAAADQPKVAIIPKLEVEQRFAAEGVVVPPTQVKLHKAAVRKPNLALTIAVYSVVGIATLALLIVAIIFGINRSNPVPVEVATNEVKEAANNGAAGAPAAQPAANEPVTDPVADSNPKPLVEIDDPTEQPVRNNPPTNNNTADPFGQPIGNQPAPNNDSTDGGDMNEGEMNNEGPMVAVDPPVTPMPEPMTQPMTEPMPPATPFIPAFQDLAKAVDLPVVGNENWQNEVVLGTLHLQPRDLLVAELKGTSKAFRDSFSFTVMGADGGTAVNAYDFFSVNGTNREKIGRLWVDGDQLKFKYYADAENAAAANHLRNCYLSMRTGTAVGGCALRTPTTLAALTLDDRRLSSEAEVRLEFPPDVSAMEFQVLPLAENFPEYGFRDATSRAPVKKSEIDIIFGGKYSAAMFLQVSSRYTNRLTLGIDAFLIQGNRSLPYKSDDIERTLQQASAIKQDRAARIAAVPADQRARFQNELAVMELERQEAEKIEKQATDQLQFIDSMKGQSIPVALYFMADEYRVYLGTPTGKPLD